MISKVVGTNPSISLTCAPTGSQLAPMVKNLAPGEARTPDLRISLSVLTYKYDALTDCATGAKPVTTSVWAIATNQPFKGIVSIACH